MTVWQAIRADLKQRFLKFNTLHGINFIITGLLLLWSAKYALQFSITIAAAGGGLFFLLEGLRMTFSNPIKAAIAFDMAKAKHRAFLPAPPGASQSRS